MRTAFTRAYRSIQRAVSKPAITRPSETHAISRWRTVWRQRAPGLRAITAGVALAAVALACAVALKLFEPLPLERARATSQTVTARDGQLLRAFAAPDDRWRLDAHPSAISPDYLDLLFAFEDKRFRDHPGVDPLALGRALLQAIQQGRAISGGSTLTMQVARLLRGSPTRSIPAKFQQIADALRLEAAFSKDEILALYLKLAPYGGNLEGVRAASLAYFGKEPARLNIAEAALLVAIPQSPETRRPDRAPITTRTARDRVIDRAHKAGAISAADAVWAKSQPIPEARRDFPMLAAHLADRLRTENPNTSVIRTTLDRTLQASAEAITHRHVEALGEKLSIAAILLDHRTGKVLAHVGSPGYLNGARLGGIDMTAAIRSPGSALKPFIYGLAFENGLAHPETLIEDRPARFEDYAPANFDKTWRGTVSMRQALQLSLNVPAVKVLAELSPVRLVSRFRDAGFPFEMPRNLAVALGGTGMTLEHLAALYTALPNGGTPKPLEYLWREGEAERTASAPRTAAAVASSSGTAGPTVHAPLLQRASAWYVLDILRGTPPPAYASGGGIAFKTGTSYGYRDAWAVGFDGAHLVSVWIGRPDATSVADLMGLQAAAPVMFELFAAISPHRTPFPQPPRDIVVASKSADLPPPLRRFRETLDIEASASASASQTLAQTPLRIAFPPAGAEIEIGAQPLNSSALSFPLKAEGGTLPLTWLVDGQPLASSPHRREAFFTAKGPGFVQVTVIDSDGRSDRSQIRLR